MVKHSGVHRIFFQGGGGGGGVIPLHACHERCRARQEEADERGGGGGVGLRHFCFPFSKFWVNFVDTE